ncbi:MAG: YmdB family metallophosphoesterase [Alphaproteobacteria bacterium]|nr:YmdB family metallophosphoesterase [Alphaproteobacteria bacterium]
MKLLFLGDIVGRSGRDAVVALLPGLKRDMALDAIVINGENAAHGFGITPKLCQEFYAAGVDAITLGNHSWDQKELMAYADSDPRLIRPLNTVRGTPGRGFAILELPRGKKLLAAQVIGRLFMDAADDPFGAIDDLLARYPLKGAVSAILVDVHAEATSEKMGMGHYLDGRVSAVIGTHSHIPTADAQVLPKGTAYQTDAGMCGDYDSVIGMGKETAVFKLSRKLPTDRLAPADGQATVCGVLVEIDNATGLASSIAPLRLGGRLIQASASW